MSEDINLDDWADCIVDGCTNKCCLRLNSKRCYPHSLCLPIDFLEWFEEQAMPIVERINQEG